MTSHLFTTSLLLASFGLSAAAQAPAGFLPSPNSGSPNRIGLNYRMGFNISAKFKNLGGFPALTMPGPAVSGVNHYYDDGYNLVDASGNAPLPGSSESVTSFWGVDDTATQVTQGSSQVDGTVVMHSSSSPADGRTGAIEDGEPFHGFELTYRRFLFRKERFQFGLEGAFGYTTLGIGDGSSLTRPVTVLTDSYNLGDSTTVSQGPHVGSYEGPGVLLGDTPSRTLPVTPGGAAVSGTRDFDADLFGLRVGPYVEMPLWRNVSASLSGGLALVSLSSDFAFTETVTIPGVGTQSRFGSGSDSEWLVGGYAAAALSYALSPSLDLSASVQYQNVGKYTQHVGGKKAELDLGESFFLSLGVGYSF